MLHINIVIPLGLEGIQTITDLPSLKTHLMSARATKDKLVLYIKALEYQIRELEHE
jgi:hypothetical protein